MTGIGFFAPLPLAMMMPFMAGQSMVMGEAFGKSYQYGKRKISSMTNDEFNKLTTKDLAEQLATDYEQILPSLQKSIENSRNFQTKIIEELARIVPTIPGAIIEGVTEGSKDSSINFPWANADTGQTTQQQYQQNNPNTFEGLIAALTTLALSIAQGGLGRPIINTNKNPDPGTENFGPQKPPTNTLTNIEDIYNQINKGIIKSPVENIVRKTEPDPTAARKRAIAESGLSPLAYAAVEQFKKNIDKAKSDLQLAITELAKIKPPLNNASIKKNHAIFTSLKTRSVAKLSALRIKFYDTYGYYY